MRLLRDRAFRLLWAGQSISILGDHVTLLALPLAAVLVVDAGAAEMGILAAAGWAPHLLLSLAAGVWLDRSRRRRAVCIAADVARAAVLATVPLAYALDALTIEHLVAVAFLIGSLTVVFDTGLGIIFPLVVRREDYVEGQSAVGVSRSVSAVAGPGLAGALVQGLGAPAALLADTASFAASAGFLARLPVEEPPRARATARVLEQLREGLRFVLRHPLLRPSVLCTATINLFNMAFNAIVVLFLAEELDFSAALIGVIFSAGALGALAGAFVAPRVRARLGTGRAIVVGAVLFPAPLLAFPLVAGPRPLVVATLVAAEALASLGVMIFDVNNNALNVLATPHRLRGRQFGATRTIVYGVRPLGALAGGALGAWLGLRPALAIGAAGALLGVGWLLASAIPSVVDLPEAVDPADQAATAERLASQSE